MGISLFFGGSKRLPRWFGAPTVFGSIKPCRMVKNGPKKCPRVPGWVRGGVQSLFGQCPNVGGVKRIGSSLRTICTVRYSTFLGGLAFMSPEKKIDANCCIHVVVWTRWITETTGIIFWSRVGFARSNVWLTGHPVNKHEFRDVCQKKRENVGILKKKTEDQVVFGMPNSFWGAKTCFTIGGKCYLINLILS